MYVCSDPTRCVGDNVGARPVGTLLLIFNGARGDGSPRLVWPLTATRSFERVIIFILNYRSSTAELIKNLV